MGGEKEFRDRISGELHVAINGSQLTCLRLVLAASVGHPRSRVNGSSSLARVPIPHHRLVKSPAAERHLNHNSSAGTCKAPARSADTESEISRKDGARPHCHSLSVALITGLLLQRNYSTNCVRLQLTFD